jgi:hypothetical protein
MSVLTRRKFKRQTTSRDWSCQCFKFLLLGSFAVYHVFVSFKIFFPQNSCHDSLCSNDQLVSNQSELYSTTIPKLSVVHSRRTCHDLTDLSNREVVMVTTTGEWSREFAKTVQSFANFCGRVFFVVVAPLKICAELRDNKYAVCLNDSTFGNNGGYLPVVPKLLKAAGQHKLIGVTKWIGLMNGDIVFDDTLVSALAALEQSKPCFSFLFPSRCAIVGQRIDVDWTSGVEKVHWEYGLDYFIFNNAAFNHVLQEDIPEFVIGTVRWDSWLMGHLTLSRDIEVIDASLVIKARHFMSLKDAFASKTKRDITNLKLSDERYRLGRTDNANYNLTREMNVIPLRSKDEIAHMLQQNQLRWNFDQDIEKATNFSYTTVGLPSVHVGCFCNLLLQLRPIHYNSSIVSACSAVQLVGEGVDLETAHKVVAFPREIFGFLLNSPGFEPTTSLPAAELTTSTHGCCILSKSSRLPQQVPGKAWIRTRPSMSFLQCTHALPRLHVGSVHTTSNNADSNATHAFCGLPLCANPLFTGKSIEDVERDLAKPPRSDRVKNDLGKSLVCIVTISDNLAHDNSKAIDSVVKQTYQNMDIIIVEVNGRSHRPRGTTIVTLATHGDVGQPFNLGFERCSSTSDFAMFLSHHELMDVNVVESMVTQALTMDSDIVLADVHGTEFVPQSRVDPNTSMNIRTEPNLLTSSPSQLKLYKSEVLRKYNLKFPE